MREHSTYPTIADIRMTHALNILSVEQQQAQYSNNNDIQMQSLKEYFAEEWLRTIQETNPLFLSNTLQTVLQDITFIGQVLAEVHLHRIRMDEHQNILKSAQKIQIKLSENEVRIMGKRYFHEFMEDETLKKDILCLIKTAPESEQMAWNNRLRELTSPNLSRTVKNAALSTASYFFSPCILLGRAMLPTSMQQSLPATLDSECKLELLKLAEKNIAVLPVRIIHIEEDIQKITQQFAPHLPQLQEKIQTLIPSEYKKILDSIEISKKYFQEIKTLYKEIADHQLVLSNMRKITPEIQAWMHMHNTFVVRILSTLSKLCSLFKTETVQQVTTLKTIENSIIKLSLSSEHILHTAKETLSKMHELNPALREHIKTKFDHTSQQTITDNNASFFSKKRTEWFNNIHSWYEDQNMLQEQVTP